MNIEIEHWDDYKKYINEHNDEVRRKVNSGIATYLGDGKYHTIEGTFQLTSPSFEGFMDYLSKQGF